MGFGNERKKDAERLSRRHFLKYGGAAATGMVASTLTGCGGGGSGSNSDTIPPVSDGDINNPKNIEYTVYETDVICIGTGIGGSSALHEALKGNRKITVLDKGPYRAAGASGMNWDTQYVWYRPIDPKYSEAERKQKQAEVFNQNNLLVDGQMVNGRIHMKAITSDPNLDQLPYYGKQGEILPMRHHANDRFEEGELELMFGLKGAYYDPVDRSPGNLPFAACEGGYQRHGQDYVAGSSLLTIHDRVMVTNAVIEDGVCLGVTAVHLPTGEYRLYKANAVVYNTGGACHIFGSANSLRAKSINVPENTSDLDMALFRQGFRIGDSEFASYDIMNTEPRALAHSFNLGIGGDSVSHDLIVDETGLQITRMDVDGNMVPEADLPQHYLNLQLDRGMFNNIIVNHQARGHQIYLDTTQPTALDRMRPAYKRSVKLWQEEFGFDPLQKKIPIAWEMYEHGGTPFIDENMQVEGAKGLFCIRGAGSAGSNGGANQIFNVRLGSYAFRCAKDYLDSNPTRPEIDMAKAEAEFARLDGIRTKKTDAGGVRPHVIRKLIQDACSECVGLYRADEELNKAKNELARIRQEVLPNQVIEDSNKVYNIEWKKAVENQNLLDIAELTVLATLERKESRGAYIRPNYPQDNNNWLKVLLAKKEGDNISFSTEVVNEDIDYTSVPWTA